MDSKNRKPVPKEPHKKIFIGKYEITKVIGKGGMGQVFLGVHPTLKIPVVLKKLTNSRSRVNKEMFKNEASVMLSLTNENLVRCYDHFDINNSTFISMEYVKGKSLADIIAKEEKIPIPLAMYILYQAAKGIHFAHLKKIVHRDIKPHNILISEEGDVKITDFGIAKEVYTDATQTEIIGTPAYMAPEQFDLTQNITRAVDIYSLGVVFYEMITGVKPFENRFSKDLINKKTKGKYPSIGKYIKFPPLVVEMIIRKMMNRDPKKRFNSLLDLIKIIGRYLKPYNSYEMKAAVKSLVIHDKDINNTSFMLSVKERDKNNINKATAVLLSIFIIGLVTLFIYSNSIYELILPDYYGKVEVRFNIANLQDAVLEIDEKIVDIISDKNLDKDGNYSKVFYVPRGGHTFSVLAGSYRNSKNEIVKSITRKGMYKKTYQDIFIPIREFSKKEVTIYFRFWDAANPKKLLSHFDYAPSTKADIYLLNRDDLKILVNNRYIPLKNYIYDTKTKSKNAPFYSGESYRFRMSGFSENGIYYNQLDFEINFAMYDQVLVLHNSLIPSPATIEITSNVKNFDIYVNGNKYGYIFDTIENRYEFSKYNNIHTSFNNKVYKKTLLVPPNDKTISVDKKNEIAIGINENRVGVNVVKKDGKYSLEKYKL